MEKTIRASEIVRNFGKFLREVEVKGEKIVVERNGQPVAAVVPLNVYQQWKNERKAFFEKLREIAERSNLEPDEAEELAEEAVNYIRNKPAEK